MGFRGERKHFRWFFAGGGGVFRGFSLISRERINDSAHDEQEFF